MSIQQIHSTGNGNAIMTPAINLKTSAPVSNTTNSPTKLQEAQTLLTYIEQSDDISLESLMELFKEPPSIIRTILDYSLNLTSFSFTLLGWYIGKSKFSHKTKLAGFLGGTLGHLLGMMVYGVEEQTASKLQAFVDNNFANNKIIKGLGSIMIESLTASVLALIGLSKLSLTYYTANDGKTKQEKKETSKSATDLFNKGYERLGVFNSLQRISDKLGHNYKINPMKHTPDVLSMTSQSIKDINHYIQSVDKNSNITKTNKVLLKGGAILLREKQRLYDCPEWRKQGKFNMKVFKKDMPIKFLTYTGIGLATKLMLDGIYNIASLLPISSLEHKFLQYFTKDPESIYEAVNKLQLKLKTNQES